jgi:urease accessory protein
MKILRLNSAFLLSKKYLLFALAFFLTLLIVVEPANAHHPLEGEIPNNFFEGFMSGLAHPIIGLDHFAFVIAIGLLAALKNKQGILIPTTFILTTLIGTGIHLLEINLPFPEIIISLSVLAFGILLAQKNSLNLFWLMVSAAIAGIFHGYAYGESIIGAQMTPLVAYLAGFALIQLIIALISFIIGKFSLKRVAEKPSLSLRFAGFIICGVGATFLASAIVG